jgi:hypothetical protein
MAQLGLCLCLYGKNSWDAGGEFYLRSREHNKCSSRELRIKLLSGRAAENFVDEAMRGAGVITVAVTWAATALVTSRIMYDGVVKSFEVSSVSFVSSGNSLHIKAERRTAKTKTLATLLLNWTVIPDAKRQQPVTPRLKSNHLVDTVLCQTPITLYDVPRVVAVTENPCRLNRSMQHHLV